MIEPYANIRPRARVERLIVAYFDGEALIQDASVQKAHGLNPFATAVFRLCDGERSVAQIASVLSREMQQPVDATMVWYAIGVLQSKGLLEQPVVDRERRLSRKQMLKMGAGVGLAAVATIAIPTVAAAASSPCAAKNCSTLQNTGGGKNTVTCCTTAPYCSTVAPNSSPTCHA